LFIWLGSFQPIYSFLQLWPLNWLRDGLESSSRGFTPKDEAVT
jgi:hypothetical protein